MSGKFKLLVTVCALGILSSCSKVMNIAIDKKTTSANSSSSIYSSSAIVNTYETLTLEQGKSITVGALNLAMQTDGNLVLYKGSTTLWYTNSAGQNCSAGKCYVVFKGDGNLVVYNGPTAIWDSRSGGNPGSKLFLSDTMPYLSIMNSEGLVAWETLATFNSFTLTSGQMLQSGHSKLVFNSDGTLVLYRNKDAKVLWTSKTSVRSCSSNCVATLSNGNLVLTQNGVVYWSTKTAVTGSNTVALSRRPPYISLRTPAGKVLWASGQGLTWIGPLEPLNGFKGGPDFLEMFKNPSAWSTALTRVNVFKIYSWYIDNAPAEDLKMIFQFLKTHDIALAVEYGAVTPPASGKCGAVEGYVGYGGSAPATLAGRIAQLGGDLAYVALDEPLNGAHYPYTYGPPPAVGCESSILEVAVNIANSYLTIAGFFPSVQFGDVENVTAFPETANWIADYGQFLDGFKYGTSGSPITFFQDDALFANGVWQKRANALLGLLESKDVSYGMIHNGVGAPNTKEWMTAAQARIQTYKTLGYPDPEQHIFQTWTQEMPDTNLPDTSPTSLTYLVNYYFSDYAKAPGPVVIERMTHAKLGVWLYSVNTSELGNLSSKDWSDRQHVAYIYPTAAGDSNLVPMVRMVYTGNGDHLYTCNPSEVISATKLGYQSEGIIGYAYGPEDLRGTPFYNLVTPRGIHFYSTSKKELTAIKDQWGGVEDPLRCRVVPYIIDGWKW